MPQFFFAWVEGTETTFLDSHARYDESVFSFAITGREGSCAQMSLTIKNPKLGLLSAGRKVWAWLSYSDGSTGATASPLFFGRLVGIPNMQGSTTGFADLLTLTLVAKPIDFAAQRRTLAESLAVLPYYDPLFIDEKLRIDAVTHTGEVDTVLEARSARWHSTRGEDGGALALTISDSNLGEDGDEVFESGSGSPAGVDPTTVNLSINGAPLTSVTVKASVAWKESVPTGPSISVGNWLIDSYTGQAIVSSWPKPGQSLGGGWLAADGTSAIDLYNVSEDVNAEINYNWQNTARKHTTGDTMSVSYSSSLPKTDGPAIHSLLYEDKQAGLVWAQGGVFSVNLGISNGVPGSTTNWSGLDGDDGDVINIPMHYDMCEVDVPQSRIQASLNIIYDSGRNRSEHVNFTMIADVQPVLTDPGDFDTSADANPPDETILEINGADPTTMISGAVPVPDPSVPSYFATDRGQQSIEYLLLRSRALLLAGARLVQMSWSVPFSRAIAFTCRKNATLVWDKLPGGQVSGKISEYTITAGGDGKLGGTVTIMGTVGNGTGTSYTTISGNGSYVTDGYTVAGYQAQIGAQTALAGGDVAFEPLTVDTTTALSAPLTSADVLESISIHGSMDDQRSAIVDAIGTAKAPLALGGLAGNPVTIKQNMTSDVSKLVAAALEDKQIWMEIALKTADVAGSADMQMAPSVLSLLVPKTTDLAT